MNAINAGIDIQSTNTYFTLVDFQSGRPQVRSMQMLSADAQVLSSCHEVSAATLSVPDAEVLVKHLRLPGQDPGAVEQRLKFELSRSVLESEGTFLFDYHAVDDSEHYLGFIFRREQLARLAEQVGLGTADSPALQYRLRSLGLARGYLTFCRQEEGLVCLADVTPSSVSICLLYGSRVIDVAGLTTGGRGLDGVADQEQLAVDLKTVVSYRLNSTADRGISLPLSSLIVSGPDITSDVRDTLQRYFSVPIAPPRINPAYLEGLPSVDQPADAFLVALGLTVN